VKKLRLEHESLEDRVSQLETEKEEWRKVSGDQAEKIKLLEAQLKDTRLKLSDEEMACQELRQEKRDIAIAAGNAEVDRNRIVNEFIPEAVRRLLSSHEFRMTLAEPFNLFYQSGLIDGANLGNEPEEAAKLLEDVEGIDMEADNKYQGLYDQALSKDYPFIQKIRKTIYRKYDKLMAIFPDTAPSETEQPTTSGLTSGPVTKPHVENIFAQDSSDQNVSAFV
jgi:chromosome segregation ATPase